MSVACAVCQTLNRDGAMFCRGCAGKLPAFMATGPSAMQLLESERPRKKRRAAPNAGGTPGRAMQMESAAFWLKWGVAMLALLLGFLAFYAYVTRKPPLNNDGPGVASTTVQGPEAKLAASPDASAAVPLASTLDAGEIVIDAKNSPATVSAQASVPVPAQAQVSVQPLAPAPAATPGPDHLPGITASSRPVPTRSNPRQNSSPEYTPALVSPDTSERGQLQRTVPPTRRDAMDPRRGCESLSFIFAARCEAANCDKAAFTRHPRCSAVREERRRDEARRNPTLGF